MKKFKIKVNLHVFQVNFFITLRDDNNCFSKRQNHPWRVYYNLANQMAKLEQNSEDICNDPMNGCPGDFAEDFGRKIDTIKFELDDRADTVPDWFSNWCYNHIQGRLLVTRMIPPWENGSKNFESMPDELAAKLNKKYWYLPAILRYQKVYNKYQAIEMADYSNDYSDFENSDGSPF